MTLEAVWLKNGEEIYWVDPVLDIICEDNMNDITDIEVYNGYDWYSAKDCFEAPDDFIVRVKKDGKSPILTSKTRNYLGKT